MWIILIVILLFYSLFLFSQNFLINKKFKLLKEIIEVFGVYFVGVDSFWWFNDSGNVLELYWIDGGGVLLEVYVVFGSFNWDWEDFIVLLDGCIFIGDFGNNGNWWQDLCIYILLRDGQLDSIWFVYLDQEVFFLFKVEWQFDMEGFFYYQDSLYLFFKDKFEQSFIIKYYSLFVKFGIYMVQFWGQLELFKCIVIVVVISEDG